MSSWTLNDIDWDKFESGKLDPELLKLVKAACMVEHHSGAYGEFLCAIFEGEPEVCDEARKWSDEEVQHGLALRRYAELADPNFDFSDAYSRFIKVHVINVDAKESVRGSLCKEMVARCAVEVGNSSYYSALRDAVDEPVLRQICSNIAGDEFRHYKLFYKYANHFQKLEGLSRWSRLKIAVGRFIETSDDELSYAYYCGSGDRKPYVRKEANKACMARTLQLYRFEHVQRGVGMSLKSAGIKPQSTLGKLITFVSWSLFRVYAGHLKRSAGYI